VSAQLQPLLAASAERALRAEAAFENHLQFLAKHRGSVRRTAEGIIVDSEADGFSSWSPIEESSSIPFDCPAIRIPPWIGAGFGEKARSEGFKAGETLVYMDLSCAISPAGSPAGLEIQEARSEAGALAFADVQAEGFAIGDPAVDSWWARFFSKAALKNFEDPTQTFYLGFHHEVAVACLLLVRSAETAGIYAVATRPAFRRKGFSQALLQHAQNDVAKSNIRWIILQAMAGAYAERYYAKLGFTELFRSVVWRR
jgi:GNAT superfamily N-acetyltransferase